MKKLLLLAFVMVTSMRAQEGQGNDDWFSRLKDAKDLAEQAATELWQEGSREFRCWQRRRMTAQQQLDALTEPATYTAQAYSDFYYEASRVQSTEQAKEVARAYAHHVALPATGTMLVLAMPLKAPVRMAVLVGALYGAKQVGAWLETYKK